MPSPAICRLASADEQIAAQLAVIARFEAALWDGGYNAPLLQSYQSAWRRLEALIAARGDDRRHHFVLIIPVADSPAQLRRCLTSLIELCRTFGYGGMQEGVFQKITVMLADDTQAPELIAAHQAIVSEFIAQGLVIDYFGLAEQLALMDVLSGIQLDSIVGAAPRNSFGHKGQAMMRNIAYLKLAHISTPSSPLLFYTLDADQQIGRAHV